MGAQNENAAFAMVAGAGPCPGQMDEAELWRQSMADYEEMRRRREEVAPDYDKLYSPEAEEEDLYFDRAMQCVALRQVRPNRPGRQGEVRPQWLTDALFLNGTMQLWQTASTGRNTTERRRGA